jgi:hypothetical protein
MEQKNNDRIALDRCYKCGVRGHSTMQCRIPFSHQVCWLCFKKDHKIQTCPMSVPKNDRVCVICLDNSTKYYTSCCSKRICRHCIPKILLSGAYLRCPCCRALNWVDDKWIINYQTKNPLLQWRLLLVQYKPPKIY